MTLNSSGLQTLIHFFSLMYKNYLIPGNRGEVCICFVPKVSRRSSPCRAIICCTCEVWDQGWDVNDEHLAFSHSHSPLSASQLSKVPMESETLHLGGYTGRFFRVQGEIPLNRHAHSGWLMCEGYMCCACVSFPERCLNFLVSQPSRWIPAPWKCRGSACYNAAEDIRAFQLLTHCVCG